MFGPFGDMFSNLLKEFTATGREQLESSILFREARRVVRQRLLREVRLNLDIIDEFADNPAQAVATLDGSAIKQVAEQPLPISLFLFRDLSGDSEVLLSELRKKNSPFRKIGSAIKTESDLIEALWGRLIISNAKVDQVVPASDTKLISVLFQALKATLEECEA